MKTSLGLGSAQFGSSYGITNMQGITDIDQVRRILDIARDRKVEWIDTARGYGNAEEVLGKALPKDSEIKIVSKIRPCILDAQAFDSVISELELRESLRLLQRDRLDGLLMHDAAVFAGERGRDVRMWLAKIRDKGLVQKIGVSIYQDSDLAGIESEFLDIVQVPMSLYDQRALHSERILDAKSSGSDIHVRSVYLQGLLLANHNQWPSWMPSHIIDRHQKLEECCGKNNISLADAALAFVKAVDFADVAFIGVCSGPQMIELTDAWEKKAESCLGDYRQWAIDDEGVLDPRKWPQR